MATNSDVRKAHGLLDALASEMNVKTENVTLLRSFLPELPKQKTLEEISVEVEGLCDLASSSEGFLPIGGMGVRPRLEELHAQMKGLALAGANPEFLETEADYENAPDGTIVAVDKVSTAWIKTYELWYSTDGERSVEYPLLSVGTRRVLRWGWGNE